MFLFFIIAQEPFQAFFLIAPSNEISIPQIFGSLLYTIRSHRSVYMLYTYKEQHFLDSQEPIFAPMGAILPLLRLHETERPNVARLPRSGIQAEILDLVQ